MFRPKKFGIVGLLVLVLGLGSGLFVCADTVQTNPASAKVREGSEPTMYEIGVRLSTLETKVDALDKSINTRIDDVQSAMWAVFSILGALVVSQMGLFVVLNRRDKNEGSASLSSKESIDLANLLAVVRDLARSDPKVREALEQRHLL